MKAPSSILKFASLILLFAFSADAVMAGVEVTRSNGMRFTGADGIVHFFGTDGTRFTGADGFLSTEVNGVRFTGADGVRFTGADGTRFTGADGTTFTSSNGVRFTGADGVRFTGADGMRFTGADGVRFTGADGTTYQADSVLVRWPNGIDIISPANVTLSGISGLQTVPTGFTLVGSDGVRFTGADAVRFTGADSITGFNSTAGVVFNIVSPTSFTLTGPNGMRFTGADVTLTFGNGISVIGPNGVRFTGADSQQTGVIGQGIQSVSPELALLLNQITDDSTVNAVVAFHNYPTQADLNDLQQIGIIGGTKFRVLPMIYITGTRQQIKAISELDNVRSIYGNRTLRFDSDPYFKITQIQRVAPDRDLQVRNLGMPVTGRSVTVAVLDTGVNAQHNDLSGRVVQNVRLIDTQSASLGFGYPLPQENIANSDLVNGHGTFVAGVIAASGISSGGKYNGVAPGANILGLSAGDLNLIHVLSGFDYLLDRGANYNVRVVNCSFSADTLYDFNDPVNIATRLLTDRGVNVVFSAGNAGSGNGTLNPYSVAPWVIGVGATNEKGVLTYFSSRGIFGSTMFAPTLVAPGKDIVSLRALATQTGSFGVGGGDLSRLKPAELPFYTSASGTSFSAPQVAGIVALMLETNPNLTPAEIKGILQRSATPLPNYFYHETGAGMVNAHAAVLEAGFSNRRTGAFRAILGGQSIKYATSTTQTFNGTVNQNQQATAGINFPASTIESTISIAWGGIDSPNDLALRIKNERGDIIGESDYINFPGLTGRREKVTLDHPNEGMLTAFVEYTFGNGSDQSFLGSVVTTRVEFDPFSDLGGLSQSYRAAAYESLRKFLITSPSGKFMPGFVVSRADLAEAMVRAGRVPQFVAAGPMYSDVRDLTTRNAVESVQSNASGRLIYDATTGGLFRPDAPATKLASAIALVKSAGLENLAAATTLPVTVHDRFSIPAEWRGYAAVALQRGWLTLDGNNFNQNRPLTKIELAVAITKIAQ